MYESMSLITDGNIETRKPCRLREKSYSVATPFLQQRWGRFLSIFFKTRSGFCITSIANVTGISTIEVSGLYGIDAKPCTLSLRPLFPLKQKDVRFVMIHRAYGHGQSFEVGRNIDLPSIHDFTGKLVGQLYG